MRMQTIGVLDEYQEEAPQIDTTWYTVESSRAIPTAADWLIVGCTGEVPDEKSELADQSPKFFKVYCDDIEVFLEPEMK